MTYNDRVTLFWFHWADNNLLMTHIYFKYQDKKSVFVHYIFRVIARVMIAYLMTDLSTKNNATHHPESSFETTFFVKKYGVKSKR